MPGPDVAGPPFGHVNLSNRFTISKDPVVVGKVVQRHALWISHRPVMGVMEKKPEVIRLPPAASDAANQVALIPLVNDHKVRPRQNLLQIDRLGIVKGAFQARISGLKLLNRGIAMLLDQVSQAPVANRLVNGDLMAALLQFSRVTAKKVSVSVVPV